MRVNTPLVFSVYSEGCLDRLEDSFSKHIRPGDGFVIISGNFENELNIPWVNSSIQTLRSLYPLTEIYVLTAGRDKLSRLVSGIMWPVEGVGHVYEPGTPGFSSNEAETLKFFLDASTLVRGQGFKSCVMPTGRPVFGTLDDTLWDYGRLALSVDIMFPQLQTWARQNRWKEALNLVYNQFKAQGFPAQIIPQITIDLPPAQGGMVNGVDAETGAVCMKQAQTRGVTGLVDFFAAQKDRAEENAKALQLVRPVA